LNKTPAAGRQHGLRSSLATGALGVPCAVGHLVREFRTGIKSGSRPNRQCGDKNGRADEKADALRPEPK